MIEQITVNNSTYEIKKKLSFGHMKKINHLFGDSISADEIPDLTTLSTEQLLTMRPKIEARIKLNDSQLELMSDIIKYSLDFTTEDLETISYEDGLEIFNKIVEASQPKKKSHQL